MLRYDVSIDLTEAILSPGMPPSRAAELVRAAVRALPGAGWVSVEDCRGAPPGLRWVTTSRRGARRRRAVVNGRAFARRWQRRWSSRWPDREGPAASDTLRVRGLRI